MRTGRHAEAAAHVAAIRTEDVASLSPRLALLAAGLFETALTIPGIDRWPFDLARVQLAYGERLRRTRARQCRGCIWPPRWRPYSSRTTGGFGCPEPFTGSRYVIFSTNQRPVPAQTEPFDR